MPELLEVRRLLNKWIGETFPLHRNQISHTVLSCDSGVRVVELLRRKGTDALHLGEVVVEADAVTFVEGTVGSVIAVLEAAEEGIARLAPSDMSSGLYEFRFGDGIAGAASLDDGSVDLLLTDPPYSISKAYTCETQVPRRSRKNGTDFIMPRGHFGDWDNSFPSPGEWTAAVLPKVRGWAVIFCAQAQIGEYCDIFEEHGLIAIGPMVWHKTNPVPFNHRYKPINAWEAIMVGKRPGTKFNGHAVHNVFTYKSPSPQQRIHPTQKPLPLVAEFVDLFSDVADLVLDPFAGSGTTLIAAVEKERRVLAFENDLDIFTAATQRIADLGLSE